YNAPALPSGHPDEKSETDVLDVARAVGEALEAHGFATTLLAASPPLVDVLQTLDRQAPDVVFNLIEGFGGRSAGATHFTGLLDLAGFAYTGSTADSLAFCAGKGRAKALLRGFGIPTAPYQIVAPGRSIERWEWSGPVIVKPDAEDGSLGIDQASVVSDRDA